jgi:hypothetical protein
MMEAPEKPHAGDLQPSLFDSLAPAVTLTPTHKVELATAVEALLREIAAALAETTAREGGHE